MLSDSESNLSAAAALGTWGTPKALPALLEAYKKALSDEIKVFQLQRRVSGVEVAGGGVFFSGKTTSCGLVASGVLSGFFVSGSLSSGSLNSCQTAHSWA